MPHRDDREALRAQVESLKQELADVQADREREQRRTARPGLGAKLGKAFDRTRAQITKLYGAIVSTPVKWTPWRARGFGAVAAMVLGVALATVQIWGAATERQPTLTTFDIALIVGLFVGPPLGVGVAALVFRAPGSVLWSGAGALAVLVFAVMFAQLVPMVRDAPRQMFLGRAAGTVEAVSAQPGVAWAQIAPAYVWLDRMGGASDTVMRNGRQETRSEFAAPIVPAIPSSGATSLFVCGDPNWMRLTASGGSGAIDGRVENAVGLELQAIARTGVTVGPQPRCVSPAMWNAQTALALGLVAMMLWLVVFSFGGAFALMRIAGG